MTCSGGDEHSHFGAKHKIFTILALDKWQCVLGAGVCAPIGRRALILHAYTDIADAAVHSILERHCHEREPIGNLTT